MYLHRCKDANLKIMVLSPPCYESQNIQMQTLKAIYVITLYNCELALPTKKMNVFPCTLWEAGTLMWQSQASMLKNKYVTKSPTY